MNKIGLIIRREYWTRVRKKSFIIMTLVGPLLFAGLTMGSVFLAMLDNTEHEVLIVDQDNLITRDHGGTIAPRFVNNFEGSDNIRYHFTNNMLEDSIFKNSIYTLMVDINGQNISKGHTYLTYKKTPSLDVKSKLNNDISKSLEEMRVKDSLNIAWEKYKSMKVHMSFIERDIDKVGVEENASIKAGIGFVFAIVIYMFIFLYGTQVMRGVIEEKTNRIVEVLISSVKPFQLMMGKVLGIGLVALTQFVAWVVLGAVFTTLGLAFFGADSMATVAQAKGSLPVEVTNEIANAEAISKVMDFMNSVNWPLLIFVFIFYFIGGFLLYGSLFAAIGSAVDSETDTQQFMIPVSIPLIFGFFISEMMIINPEGPAAVWGSIIPLTSPVVIMVRTAIGFDSGEIWVLIVSMVLLVATFLGVIWIAAKIYRTGVLMYGKKASYKEIWKWLTYKG